MSKFIWNDWWADPNSPDRYEISQCVVFFCSKKEWKLLPRPFDLAGVAYTTKTEFHTLLVEDGKTVRPLHGVMVRVPRAVAAKAERVAHGVLNANPR